MNIKNIDQELRGFIIKLLKSVTELKTDFDNLSENNRQQFETAAMDFLRIYSYKFTIEDIRNWFSC